MIMNSYERNLANRLQMQMSKREAEDAIYSIRESLYGDMDEMIRPRHIVDKRGNVRDEYPPVKAVIWAYFNDGFEKIGYSLEQNEEPGKITKIILIRSITAWERMKLSDSSKTKICQNRRNSSQ